jgi:hypothetical protein
MGMNCYFSQRKTKAARGGRVYPVALLLFDSLLLLALCSLTKNHVCMDWCCWFMWYKVPCSGARITQLVANTGGM